MNIVQILAQQAAQRGPAPAIVEPNRAISFAQLHEIAERAAALLHEAGLQPEDPILVLQPMSIDLYTALIGIFRLGCIAMVLDPAAGREHINRCCELAPPRAFIASARAHLLRLQSPALRAIPAKFVIGPWLPGATPWRRADRFAARREMHPADADTPALLTFTSGSTGQPKAALRTHGFLLAQHRSLAASLRLAPGEVDVTTLPIFLLANLASGVTSVIPDGNLRVPGAIDPVPVVGQIQTHRPVSTTASPALLERLADHCAAHHLTLQSFQKIFTGGAPVFPPLLMKLRAIAPNAELTAVYGSTEAEPIAHVSLHEISGDDFARMATGQGLLAGVPVAGLVLRIMRDQWGKAVGPFTQERFDAQCLPPGETGEIVVSGPHVLAGYWRGQGDEETKFSVEAIRWHRTGDAGWLDARGRLWLLGRCAARIVDTRGVLHPFAVECAAVQFAGVHRAALIGHEGRRILALELESAAAQAPLDLLREKIAWAHLDELRVVPSIPMDKRHNAKVDYPTLRRLISRP